MTSSRLRIGDQEFGSVFKRPWHGGPKYINVRDVPLQYPGWSDPRTPGNTDSNMQAAKIMAKWTPAQMKRFEFFMDSHKVDMTPWKREWLDKTAPGHDKQREDILKCKLELVKRIITIKVTGPQSMEDWCLYFLYHDDKLDIPQNVETLIRPEWSGVSIKDWYDNEKRTDDEFVYLVADSERNVNYPGNIKLPGFEQTGDPDVSLPRWRHHPLRGRNIPAGTTRAEIEVRTSPFYAYRQSYFPHNGVNGEGLNHQRGLVGAARAVNFGRMRNVRNSEPFV